jgi:hypothetical protein
MKLELRKSEDQHQLNSPTLSKLITNTKCLYWIQLFRSSTAFTARTALDAGPTTPTFHFPFGAAIAARGFFVVFPDTYTGMLNAGNNLRLTIGGTEVDQVSVPALAIDTSYARIPDGSANWQITTNPTIDASNLSSTQVTSTPVPTKTSGHSGTGSTGSGSATPTLVTGKQPDWTKLQLPAASTSATPIATNPLVTSPAAPSASSAWDTPRRILLTVLLTALALSLFWCWKQFSPP